jgi:hypothetical protein
MNSCKEVGERNRDYKHEQHAESAIAVSKLEGWTRAFSPLRERGAVAGGVV